MESAQALDLSVHPNKNNPTIETTQERDATRDETELHSAYREYTSVIIPKQHIGQIPGLICEPSAASSSGHLLEDPVKNGRSAIKYEESSAIPGSPLRIENKHIPDLILLCHRGFDNNRSVGFQTFDSAVGATVAGIGTLNYDNVWGSLLNAGIVETLLHCLLDGHCCGFTKEELTTWQDDTEAFIKNTLVFFNRFNLVMTVSHTSSSPISLGCFDV